MFSRLMYAVGCLAMFAAGLVLQPAAPAQAAGTFFMNGTFEVHNGFSRRRLIRGFQSPVATTDPSGMGAVTILPGVFSETGNPDSGKKFFEAVGCPTTDIICAIQNALGGWQVYPGFPTFAQNASTYTEHNTATHVLGPGNGPGSFQFCPLITNPANGPATTPACPGIFVPSVNAPPTPTSMQGGLVGVQTTPSQFGVEGIVTYSGGNGFGGTMAIVRDLFVEVTQRRSTTPVRFQYDYETRMFPWMAGASFGSTNLVIPSTGPQTQSPVLGPFSSLAIPGGKLTTGGGVTPTGTGPIAPGAPVLPTTLTGFPWTTGMVRVAQDSCVAAGTCPTPFNPNFFVQFTVTGNDGRGPDGQGTLSLVAGGMFQNRQGNATGEFALLDLEMALPEPGLALGLASGIALLLGLARRRA